MANLEYMVKKEFFLLYSEKNFIKTYHERILQSILDNKYEIIEIDNKKYVKTDTNNLLIPNLPVLGKLDLEKILQSNYMIN
jgi:uncharacterized protein YdhG (YjbR/CyaY superfamily)